MPTKKRRVGFIPKSNILDLIIQLSLESNLSCSKVINILVEEALFNRGMINSFSGSIFQDKRNNFSDKNFAQNNKIVNSEFKNNFKNKLLNDKNLNSKNDNEEHFDDEIYSKFLMFLQFQEKMKRQTNN